MMVVAEQKKNSDMKLSPEYKHYLGIKEEKLLPKKVVPTKTKKQILSDDKEGNNKANSAIPKIRIKFY